MATSRKPHRFSETIALNAITIRQSRGPKNKVAHLFVGYTNGAVSGFPVSFCGVAQWTTNNWNPAPPKVPLCNRCGRAFHAERKNWIGPP